MKFRVLSSADFWPKFIFVWTKFGFLTEISILDFNFDFWPNLDFLTQNLDFWPKFEFLPKFRFLTKISIFDQNFDFLPKFRFFTKISIFDQKFRFLTKNFGFWPKISVFDQKFDLHVNFYLNFSLISTIILTKIIRIFFSKIQTYYNSSRWPWKKRYIKKIIIIFFIEKIWHFWFECQLYKTNMSKGGKTELQTNQFWPFFVFTRFAVNKINKPDSSKSISFFFTSIK